MGTKFGFREKIIKNQVVFMGVGGDQEINRPPVFKGLQFVSVTGGIDHCPGLVIHKDGVTERVSASPDEFDWPSLKIKQSLPFFIHHRDQD
jgi:hypothetical protein